jgi:eukaryotic-like serine/threonine-protein kinase
VHVAPPPPSDDLSFAYAPGDVISGKYALEEVLGEGGMGAVFRARNLAIDMPVAIKLIRADLDRELFSGRLLQEARAAAQLTHPAIVRVFDVGQTALGDPFIVMELLEGESLSTVIERDGPLSPSRAVQLLLPIADALAAAHAKGFVHRDVKPDNVFVVLVDGAVQPKLVDFGIVKQSEGTDHHLTQAGAVVGSPDYMSPEQAKGLEQVDLRSDVWSFSVMLYEAMTTVTPFEAPNYNALMREIVEARPATLEERGVCDATLSAIVAQGLNKDPDDRFASFGSMGRALAGWLVAQGVTQDACGVSLESKWLSRASDPAIAGRGSWPTLLEPAPERATGIRKPRRSLSAARGASRSAADTTRSSFPPVAHATLGAPPRRWLVVAAVVCVTLAVLLLRASLSRSEHVASPKEAVSVPQAAVATASLAAPPPPSALPVGAVSSGAPSAAPAGLQRAP